MTGLLEGKRVLVTGGSRGIGAAIVSTAMQEGAEVAFTYRSRSDLAEELAEDMIRVHPERRCVPLQCDAADTTAMREAIKGVIAELGGVHVLVNNAGIT